MIMPRMIFSSIQARDEKKTRGRKNGSESWSPPSRAPSSKRNNDYNPRVCAIGRRSSDDSDTKMRLLLAIIVIIYLVGVGVVLSPIIRSTWNTEPASVLADHVIQALPDALTWPMKAARAFAGS
jgi:hypothetical protein